MAHKKVKTEAVLCRRAGGVRVEYRLFYEPDTGYSAEVRTAKNAAYLRSFSADREEAGHLFSLLCAHAVFPAHLQEVYADLRSAVRREKEREYL